MAIELFARIRSGGKHDGDRNGAGRACERPKRDDETAVPDGGLHRGAPALPLRARACRRSSEYGSRHLARARTQTRALRHWTTTVWGASGVADARPIRRVAVGLHWGAPAFPQHTPVSRLQQHDAGSRATTELCPAQCNPLTERRARFPHACVTTERKMVERKREGCGRKKTACSTATSKPGLR